MRHLMLAVALVGLLSGCGTNSVEEAPQDLPLAQENAILAWLDFEDMRNATGFRARPNPFGEWEFGEPLPALITFRQAATRYGSVDIALRAARIPECGSCSERACFGFEGYYKANERLAFVFASQNEHHQWAFFGSTPPDSQWLDEDGFYHFRIAGIALDYDNPFEDYARLAMIHFDDLAPEGGDIYGFSQMFYKLDNTETTGWCMMDGTAPTEITVQFFEL